MEIYKFFTLSNVDLGRLIIPKTDSIIHIRMGSTVRYHPERVDVVDIPSVVEDIGEECKKAGS